MDRLGLSDAALETLTDSDVAKLADEMDMRVPRRSKPREHTLRRIRALRDQLARLTESSGRGLEPVCFPTSARLTARVDMI